MDISLEGKVAIVTGTGPNIGSGLALMLSKYGAKVACNDIRPEAAEAAVDRIQRNGGTAIAILGDVTDEATVTAYVDRVVQEWGQVDILVNCAGILGGASVLDYDLERFNRQLLTNCTGNFLNTKHVAKSMIDRGVKGSIICIVSTAGWQGQAGNIGYCTSKGGIIQFVRAAAMDLAPYGIRVNSFTPTATQADNPELLAARRAANQGAVSAPRTSINFGQMIPLGEQPTPTDYGHMVAFLASDVSRLVTGSDFRVDGGALAKYWPYTPPAEKAGPLPLVAMDITEA
jgi:NAD(P)-dependent dehydrogenase (short-subunit alcohol dehydrogenase family)